MDSMTTKTMTSPMSTKPSVEMNESLSAPTTDTPSPDVVAFRESEEGKKVVDWALSEFERCKSLKARVTSQWNLNLNMLFGKQWVEIVNNAQGPAIRQQQAPKWKRRKTINRLRSFQRTECSKLQSTLPSIVAVPSTAEDEDVRAAYAAEQAWQSYAEVKRFRRQYNAAIWWAVVTGNGFLKVWWNSALKVRLPDGEDQGDIDYRKVSPLNIFIPEPREREIEDQPYVIEAYTRTVEWANSSYPEALKGKKLAASTSSVEFAAEGALGADGAKKLDSVTVKEMWVKPGANKILPEGGFLVLVDDILVDYMQGYEYSHGEYPYTKIEHMYNDTFWADSPLVDLIQLQREYNELRTEVAVAARRMGTPQLLVSKGSVQVSKLTNEPGSVIEFNPGHNKPEPLPLSALPQYVLEQQDRVLQDFEDISGQHDVSKGQAPTGVTAGTALAYLGERDDNYLTPQYQGVEEAFERIAKQTLMLFQQYVDVERKIKVIGLDGAFDTLLLSGADIAHGTDIRVQPGSSVGQSQAAKMQQVMDLVGMGMLPPEQGLKMLELGGPQKVLDIMNAAERKAQRENMRMKALKDNPEEIEQAKAAFIESAQPTMMEMIQQMVASGMSPEEATQQIQQAVEQSMPPVIAVDDFDIHEVHIEVHNRFRMSQEYEALPPEVKEEFDKHVQSHHQIGGQIMQEQLMQQMPPEISQEDAMGQMGPGGSMPPQGPEMAGPPQ